MKKDSLLKIGLIIGLVYAVFVVSALVAFNVRLEASDPETIGTGLLLPILLAQIVPCLLIYLISAAPSTIILFRAKDKSKTFLSEKKWRLTYKANCLILMLNIIMLVKPIIFLPFALSALT